MKQHLDGNQADDLRFLQEVTLDEAMRIINETSSVITELMISCHELCDSLNNDVSLNYTTLKKMSEEIYKNVFLTKHYVKVNAIEMENMLGEFVDYVMAILIDFKVCILQSITLLTRL
jgi:hypothetical protein